MTIGILGGGQLGDMLAQAGYPLGLSFRVVDPTPDAPTARIAEHLAAPYTAPAVLDFLRGCSVVTYEFENVPLDAAASISGVTRVLPPARALEVAQDRLTEKRFFQQLGIRTAPFQAVDTEEELRRAVEEIGLPAVLKTRRMGYDGKGQVVLHTAGDMTDAWRTLGGQPLILEGLVRFTRELSILGVRSLTGDVAFYPLVENHHHNGILSLSLAPATGITPRLRAQAEEYARRLLDELAYVGVLAVELFEVNGTLLANEMAPRVHNSGHWTIEGAGTSQFENHVRAVAGLPLGSTAARGHAAMLNLIGAIPAMERLLAVADVHVHLYSKAPRPGRKLGHVTVTADSPEELRETVERLRLIIQNEY